MKGENTVKKCRIIIAAILVLVMSLGGYPFGISAADAATGEAGLATPLVPQYGADSKFLASLEPPDPGATEIYTAQDLSDVRDDLSGSYVLMNDIDLAAFNGGVWTPIGDSVTPFTGTFDGQGYVISNLSISGDLQYAGLFGYAEDAAISNVGLEDTNIAISYVTKTAAPATDYAYAGGVCGYAKGDTSIKNCYNSGAVSTNSSASNAYAGGICGFANASAALDNCYNTGDVSANNGASEKTQSKAGGICGAIYGNGSAAASVSNCYNTGAVSSDYEAGGICGYAAGDVSISNCYNTGVASSEAYVGGICGSTYTLDPNVITISNCYNTGAVISSEEWSYSSAGGICGYYDAPGTISDCYNTGDVSAFYYVGGICGYFAGDSDYTISNCYNQGDVRIAAHYYYTAYAGGICGRILRTSISTCYNLGDVSATAICTSVSSFVATSCAGGICGEFSGTISISNCYNQGEVSTASASMHSNDVMSAYSAAGGINGSGDSFYSSNTVAISNCYNTGVVSASAVYSSASPGRRTVAFAGGISGAGNGTISTCYNTGGLGATSSTTDSTYPAETYVGGVYGAGDASLSNCYWRLESVQIVDGLTQADLNKRRAGDVADTLTGRLTDAQMKESGSFVGFDFVNVWGFSGGFDYPVLEPQGSPAGVAAPVFSPAPGSFSGTQTITLTCATTGASIYYTTDGSAPTAASILYSGSFTLSDTTTVKAIAIKTGLTDSAVATATYTRSTGGGGGGGGGGASTTSPASSFSGSSAYTQGSSAGLTLTVQKDFSQLTSVKVDGNTLSVNKDYTAKEGSTIITLLPEYLDTLSAGNHTLNVAFKDGTSAAKSFTIAAQNEPVKQEQEPQQPEEQPTQPQQTTSGSPFTDVQPSAWYYNDVLYVSNLGLMTGTAPDQFSPDLTLTRGMIVTVLYRQAGSPSVSGAVNPFNDVPENEYYADGVIWAADNGIISGYGNGMFGPNDDITREQLATIIYRYQQFSGVNPPSLLEAKVFNDGDKISTYALEAVNTLTSQGIITGKPGDLFDPQGTATRAEFAAMLHRFLTSV